MSKDHSHLSKNPRPCAVARSIRGPAFSFVSQGANTKGWVLGMRRCKLVVGSSDDCFLARGLVIAIDGQIYASSGCLDFQHRVFV